MRLNKVFGMKSILCFVIALSSANVLAKDCAVCDSYQKFAKELSQIKPNPLDPATAEDQDKLILKGSRIAMRILAEEKLGEKEARVLVALLVSLIPYDNGLFTVQDNIVEFKNHYRNSPILRSVIIKMVEENKITRDQRDTLLEWYGIRPGK